MFPIGIKRRLTELRQTEDLAERRMLPEEQTPSGTAGRSGSSALFIAKVISDADGGGYYNCKLQTFDAGEWDTDNNPFSDTGESIVVLNLAEYGEDIHNLDADDLISCWNITDNGDNVRYVGVEVFGRHTFEEWP